LSIAVGEVVKRKKELGVVDALEKRWWWEEERVGCCAVQNGKE
jgi:hypothetical protein